MMISDDYRQIQQKFHVEHPEYGIASVAYAPFVSDIANQLQAENILDYGSGKGRLAKSLKLDHKARIHMYDPAVPELSEDPEPQELVACIDVLEHIEPECLDNVLDDLKRVTAGVGVFTVSTEAAKKELPDGRNAHLIQQPMEWWLPKIMSRFTLQSLAVTQGGFFIVVRKTRGIS